MKLRRLFLGRKAMTNIDSLLKSKDITLPTKVHLVKAMVFPVVMYERESRTIKKAERWRIAAFELWCWRRFLRVPWTARRSNQSKPNLKEINPEYSLEELMLKLKLQYFGHLIRANSLEKTLMLGKTEGRRRRGQQRMRWLDGITDSMDMHLSKPHKWWRTGKPGVLQAMGSQRVGHDWATEQRSLSEAAFICHSQFVCNLCWILTYEKFTFEFIVFEISYSPRLAWRLYFYLHIYINWLTADAFL